MSQDLCAAFEESAPPPPSVQQHAKPTPESRPWRSPFEDPQPAQWIAGAGNQPITTDSQAPEDDEDDFGDFEDASISAPPALSSKPKEAARLESVTVATGPTTSSKKPSPPFPPKAQKRDEPPPQTNSKIGRHPFADHMDFLFSGGDDEYDAGDDELEDLSKNPEAAMAYSKRMIAEQEARGKSPPKPAPKAARPAVPNPRTARNKLQKRSGYVPAKDSTVLFDVENVSEHEDDDDFGDFEETPSAPIQAPPQPKPSPAKLQKKSGPPSLTRQQRASSKPSLPSIDLLGLNEMPSSAHPPYSKHLKAISQNSIMSPRSERAESILAGYKADSFSRPPSTGAILVNEDEPWDDFDTFEPTSDQAPKSYHSRSRTDSSPVLPTSPVSTTDRSPTTSHDTLPPTNIPPPIILLSIFPSLFASAQDALFNQLSKLDITQRQHLLGHPATHQFLRSYLDHGIVLAHIIAGRKLRWKRDQILAQSMRIGPAAAGGKGGMKLSSIDKSEQAKENREVTDVLAQWKSQAGKLRGAVATASTTTGDGTPKLGLVPDILETMPIKTLKVVEGGFTAPHACALCGLKREERVAKTDVEIDDSFGEWWVNGMDMHVTCRKWWDENKGKLKSR